MGYNVIMVDPPWKQMKGSQRKVRPNQERSLNYETMMTKEIFSLLDEQIFSNAANDHCVFMWVIEKFLVECEEFMRLRGYKRHCRFIWNKCNGIAPAFTVRFCHEYLIWYYKDRMPPIAKSVRGKYSTVITESSREHSRKPEQAYQIIEQFYPDALKIDVFSRQIRDQWLQFGDETGFYNKI
jgi:N6-adenosine-specific RNA methylase IME4